MFNFYLGLPRVHTEVWMHFAQFYIVRFSSVKIEVSWVQFFHEMYIWTALKYYNDVDMVSIQCCCHPTDDQELPRADWVSQRECRHQNCWSKKVGKQWVIPSVVVCEKTFGRFPAKMIAVCTSKELLHTHVAVPGENRTLFCCVFRLRYRAFKARKFH